MVSIDFSCESKEFCYNTIIELPVPVSAPVSIKLLTTGKGVVASDYIGENYESCDIMLCLMTSYLFLYLAPDTGLIVCILGFLS